MKELLSKSLSKKQLLLIGKLINSVEDRVVQEELYELHKLYEKAFTSLRYAAQTIDKIDVFAGSDHQEFMDDLRNLQKTLLDSEYHLIEFAVFQFDQDTQPKEA